MKSDINAAERGDRYMARHLIKVAADCLLRGVPLDGDLAHWLGNSLNQILEGVAPKKALGLSDPAGGRPPADDNDLMKRYHCFVEVESRLSQNKAMSKLQACAEVAELLGLEIGTVDTYHKREKRTWIADGANIEALVSSYSNAEPLVPLFDFLNCISSMPIEEQSRIAREALARIRANRN